MTPFDGGDKVNRVTNSTDSEGVTAFLARILFQGIVPPRGDLAELRARLAAVGATSGPPEDSALRSVVYLLDTVVTALHVDPAKHDPTFWERVQEAHDIVADFRGDTRKRRRVIEAIEWTVEHWIDRSGLDRSAVDPRSVRFGSLLTTLVYCDSRFESLNSQLAFETFDQIAALTPEQKLKHGRGLIDVNTAAARFSVAVGAFGDTDEHKSKQAYRNAKPGPSKELPPPTGPEL